MRLSGSKPKCNTVDLLVVVFFINHTINKFYTYVIFFEKFLTKHTNFICFNIELKAVYKTRHISL